MRRMRPSGAAMAAAARNTATWISCAETIAFPKSRLFGVFRTTLSRQHLDLSAPIPHCHFGATRNPVPTAHAAARKRRTHLQRGARRLGEDRRSVLRRPGRPDRADASRAGGRAQMDRRGAFPARAQFLHAAARSRGHAARDLCRLAAARHVGRPRCWVAVRAARRPCRARAQHRLRALRQVPLVEAAFVGIKAAVLVIVIEALLELQSARFVGRLDWLIAGAAFVAIFFFDVPFPLVDRRRRSVGLCACRHESRRTARASEQSPSRAPRRKRCARQALWLAIWIVPLAHPRRACSAATMSAPTSPSSSPSSPS